MFYPLRKAEIYRRCKICILPLLTTFALTAPVNAAPITTTTFMGIDFSIEPGSAGIFESVTLPDIVSGGLFGLFMWNGSEFVFNTEHYAGTPYTFDDPGVTTFRVLGLEDSTGVDDTDLSPFDVNFTYTIGDDTNNSYTMSPVYSDAYDVPAPGTLALLAAGLLLVSGASYRTKTA